MRKYSLDESIFGRIDSEEKAYWLGFILADGSIYKRMYTKLDGTKSIRQSTVKVCLSHVDKGHIQKFLSFLESNQPVKTYHYDKYSSSEVSISSKKIVEDLEILGIGCRKSHTCKLPKVPDELIKHLIRGIWDGDGSVLYRCPWTQHRTDFRFETQLCGNYKIVSKVQNILVEETRCSKTKIHSVSSIFLFRNTNSGAEKIIDYLYSNCNIALERKYKIAKRLVG